MKCVWPYWHLRPLQLFPHYLVNGKIKKKKRLLHIKCVFWFSLQLLSETFLTVRRTEWDVIKSASLSLSQVPVILVRLYWNLNFQNRFSKSTQIWNFMKIHPVVAKLLHEDRQTEMKLIVDFHNFAKVSKIITYTKCQHQCLTRTEICNPKM
jgi:hypothetical protein